MERLYTISDIAKELHIPESTAGYYVRTFIDYMPVVGEGRRKRYKPEVVEVIGTIRQAFNNHLLQDQVVELLTQKYGVNIEVSKDLDIYNNSLIEQQRVIKQMASTISDLQQQIAEVKSEVKAQGEQQELSLNERDRRLMELIRAIQEERQMTFWQKIKRRLS